jgi:sRNA-binding protein
MPVYTTREERDRAVEILAQEFPRAFFANPRQRKPLKAGIENDIAAELAKDTDHPLLDFDIVDTLKWYTSHVSYWKACSVAGVSRIDLAGKAVSKITVSEARAAEAEAADIFAEIEHRKTVGNGASTFVAPSPAPPKVSAIQVNASLSSDELLGELEKQIELVRTVLAADPDDALRKQLARSALVLMSDEIRTVIARLDQ